MPFNGAGTFATLGAPQFPAVSGEYILASYFNNNLNDIFAGLSQCWTRDGQASPTQDMPMANFSFTNMRAALSAKEPLVYDQQGARLKVLEITEQLTVSAPLVSFAGNATITGNWDFRGASLLVATQPAGTTGNAPASVDFVSVAIQMAAVSFIPTVSQSHEALAILNFLGATQ